MRCGCQCEVVTCCVEQLIEDDVIVNDDDDDEDDDSEADDDADDLDRHRQRHYHQHAHFQRQQSAHRAVASSTLSIARSASLTSQADPQMSPSVAGQPTGYMIISLLFQPRS